MWKRRAEMLILALLVAVAGGLWSRPHIAVSMPDIDIAALIPDRTDAVANAGGAALVVAIRFID